MPRRKDTGRSSALADLPQMDADLHWTLNQGMAPTPFEEIRLDAYVASMAARIKARNMEAMKEKGFNRWTSTDQD